MHYWKTLSQCIPKYFLIRNLSFPENAITKVYALEDSLGVFLIWYNCVAGRIYITPASELLEHPS